MKRLLPLILLTVVLSAGPARAEAPKLKAQRIQLDNCVLVLDDGLLDQRDRIAKHIDPLVKAWVAHKPPPNLDAQKLTKQWMDALTEVVGVQRDSPDALEAEKKLLEMLHLVAGWYMQLTPNPTVFVLRKQTALDYLDAGGFLPTLKKSKTPGDLTLTIGAYVSSTSVKPLSAFAIPCYEKWTEVEEAFVKKFVDAVLDDQIPQIDIKRPGQEAVDPARQDQAVKPEPVRMSVAISQMRYVFLQVAVLRVLGEQWADGVGERSYWLRSGLADAIGLQTLEAAGDKAGALELLGQINAALPKGVELESLVLHLRYWSKSGVTLGREPVFARLTDQRRIAALIEARRMIEKVGIEKVIAMSRTLAQAEVKSPEAVDALILKQTGYDIATRLDRHQPEGSHEQLFKIAMQNYVQAGKAREFVLASRAWLYAYDIQVMTQNKVGSAPYHTMRKFMLALKQNSTSANLAKTYYKLAKAERVANAQTNKTRLAAVWAIAALASDPSIAFELAEERAELKWQKSDILEMRIAPAVIEIIEAYRLFDEREFEQAAAQIDRAEKVFQASGVEEKDVAFLVQSIRKLRMQIDLAPRPAKVN